MRFPKDLFREELPNKQASTRPGGTHPASLGLRIANWNLLIDFRVRESWPWRADLFNLHRTVAVHDLGRFVCLFAKTRCEDHDTSTTHALDVRFRIPFDDPERRQIPKQIDLEIGVWSTHEAAARHFDWLSQNTDVLLEETSRRKIANDPVGRS